MRFILTVVLSLMFVQNIFADEVYLKNGDKITGDIVSDSTSNIIIRTEAMGEVRIARSSVKEFKTDAELEAEMKKKNPDVEWTRRISAGYAQQGGNDKDSRGNAEIFVNRKTDEDETTLKLTANIQTEDSKLDSKKFYGLSRYAHSFGDEKKWFQFVKLEADQDNTNNISYRIIPSYGVGYWFADTDDFKFRVETSAGWEYTKYDDGTSSEGEMVLSPSAHLEKKFGNGISFVQDVTLYPSLEELSEIRLRSESSLKGAITEQMNWKFSFIDDYDSNPRTGKKKNDWDLITGLEYNF